MKILILKISSLGDIVHTFPVVSYLRKRFPGAEIDWMVKKPYLGLIEAHPEVDLAITPNQGGEYDLIFDLQGNIKSGFLLNKIRGSTKVGFGLKSVSEWPNALFTSRRFNPPRGKNIREDYLFLVQNYFGDTTPFQAQPLVLKLGVSERREVERVQAGATLVCMGSRWPNKQLKEAEWIALLEQRASAPILFVWGTEEEKKQAEQLAVYFKGSRLLEKLSFPALQHVMAKSRLVIGVDSFPLHLAGTTSVPILGIFGPSSAEKYAPLGSEKIQRACPYGLTFEKRCPKLRRCKTGACMDVALENL